MPVKDTTDKLHAKIALLIKTHKKRLFKNHRDGMEIYKAVAQFAEKLEQDLVCAIPDVPENAPVDIATAEKVPQSDKPRRKAIEIPIIGSVSAEAGDTIVDTIPDDLEKREAAITA